MAIHLEQFYLDRDQKGTLQALLQQMIAEGVLSGRFRKGDKLPSTRKLAQHLGISRITVTLAYHELVASDYLHARGRSGYYISDASPEPLQGAKREKSMPSFNWSDHLTKGYAEQSVFSKPIDWSDYKYCFVYGQTDPTLFDHGRWRLCAHQALGSKDFSTLTADYYDQDDAELVEFIARHNLPRRGIIAHADEILVTVGAQNALWLAAQVLLGPKKKAVIENPCYPALREILRQTQSVVSPTDVDAQGLRPDLLPDDTDIIFTTPSHHCPTTTTLPLERRKTLLRRAKDLNAIIIEDDYEFEMSFLNPPSPSLKSLDKDGRVIYVGSFSKSLFPGLRLGYLVGSAPFIREARALRASILRHPPGHLQRTASYFLRLGHYDAMVKRLSKTYRERRLVMEEAIKACGLTIAGHGTHGGSSFWMRAPEQIDTALLAKRLREKSTLIEPGQDFFCGPHPPKTFYRLAYSSIPAERISEGIQNIAETITRMQIHLLR